MHAFRGAGPAGRALGSLTEGKMSTAQEREEIPGETRGENRVCVEAGVEGGVDRPRQLGIGDKGWR